MPVLTFQQVSFVNLARRIATGHYSNSGARDLGNIPDPQDSL